MEVMDLSSFLEEMDNDYDVVNMIIGEYISSLDEQIPLMKKLLNEKEYITISREAHSIKGGARNVMAQRLEEASCQLEQAAQREDDSAITENIMTLDKEYNIYKLFIKEHLSIPIAER